MAVDIGTSLLLIMAIMVIGFICASLGRSQFSGRIFLAVMAIGWAILVWLPVIPSWMIVFPVVMIVLMFFTGGAESE